MSVQSEINRISGNVTAALAAIAAKGVNVGIGSTSDDLATLIAAIEKGILLPALTNEGAAADLLSGKQLIDGEGNIVTGNMPSVTQATPSISVSSGGLITASATQEAGKVAAGTTSATKQLTVQAAQTITPGTANKTIASGRYLTGTQTIKGDANLLAENIKNGVSIFGVAGSLEAGGGGNGDAKIAIGTFTPTEQTFNFTVTHNLGVVPTFNILSASSEEAYGINPPAYGCINSILWKGYGLTQSGIHETLLGTSGYVYNKASVVANGAGVYVLNNGWKNSNDSSTTKFTCPSASGTPYRFHAGITYVWMVGVA